jgi:hypothetical protein
MTKVFPVLLPEQTRDLAASPLFDLFAHHLTAVNHFCSIIYLPLDGGQTAPDAQTGAGGAAGAAGGLEAALSGLLSDGAPSALDQKALGGFGGGGNVSAEQERFMQSFFRSMSGAGSGAGAAAAGAAPALLTAPRAAANTLGVPAAAPKPAFGLP